MSEARGSCSFSIRWGGWAGDRPELGGPRDDAKRVDVAEVRVREVMRSILWAGA